MLICTRSWSPTARAQAWGAVQQGSASSERGGQVTTSAATVGTYQSRPRRCCPPQREIPWPSTGLEDPRCAGTLQAGGHIRCLTGADQLPRAVGRETVNTHRVRLSALPLARCPAPPSRSWSRSWSPWAHLELFHLVRQTWTWRPPCLPSWVVQLAQICAVETPCRDSKGSWGGQGCLAQAARGALASKNTKAGPLCTRTHSYGTTIEYRPASWPLQGQTP